MLADPGLDGGGEVGDTDGLASVDGAPVRMAAGDGATPQAAPSRHAAAAINH